MKTKLSPCCARAQAKVATDQRDLATIARRASRYPESPRWAEQIRVAKAHLATSKQLLIDHEAEHAGDLAVAL